MNEPVEIRVLLLPDQADALAEMTKRIGWAEMRGMSVDDGEAFAMRDAVERLRRALREGGFAPR